MAEENIQKQPKQTNSTGGPMVTVKKSDGTSVRMSVAELRAQRGKKTSAVSANPILAEVENKPAVAAKSAVARPAAKSEDKVPTKVGSSSGMVKPVAVKSSNKTSTTTKKGSGVANPAVAQGSGVAKSKVKTDKNIRSQSLLDGIAKMVEQKKKERTTQFVKTSTNNPKVKPQVDQTSADELVKHAMKKWEDGDHKSLLDEEFHEEDINKEIENRKNNLEKVRPVANKASVTNSLVPKASPIKISETDKISQIKDPNHKSSPLLASKKKPVMQDVKPVQKVNNFKKTSTGPVDELGQITITDFRRLAPSTSAATSTLQQKFENLKEDSYLNYMEGVEAWRKSPLYTQYLKILQDSLVQKKPIAEIIATSKDPEKINSEELMSIINVNKELV